MYNKIFLNQAKNEFGKFGFGLISKSEIIKLRFIIKKSEYNKYS